jgi:predicted MFS family arabinose efflux permease
VGPIIAGLAFDHLGVPAPYWIGALLAALALLVAVAGPLANRRMLKSGIDTSTGWDS